MLSTCLILGILFALVASVTAKGAHHVPLDGTAAMGVKNGQHQMRAAADYVISTFLEETDVENDDNSSTSKDVPQSDSTIVAKVPSTTPCGTASACGSHGQCDIASGTCFCAAGWRGVGCNLPDCPDACNYNGYCIGHAYDTPPPPSILSSSQRTFPRLNLTCICYPGWGGRSCAERTCHNNCTSTLNGKCIDATCHCTRDWTGLDCSQRRCVTNCSGNGICRHGVCFCGSGWAGNKCEKRTCPTDCNGGNGVCKNGTCECIDGWYGDECQFDLSKAPHCAFNCSNHGCCREVSKIVTSSEDGGFREDEAESRRCFCEPGWTGKWCESRRTNDALSCTPEDCSGQGICVNGTCFCLPEFGGQGCSKRLCNVECVHGSCSHTVGKCDCQDGWRGEACNISFCPLARLRPNTTDIPKPCAGLGSCVRVSWGGGERCACRPGFTGVDCTQRTCNPPCEADRGVCDVVALMCICDDGWTGASCGLSGLRESELQRRKTGDAAH